MTYTSMENSPITNDVYGVRDRLKAASIMTVIAASLSFLHAAEAEAAPPRAEMSEVMVALGPICDSAVFAGGVLAEVCDYPIDGEGKWERCRTFTAIDGPTDHDCFTVDGKNLLPGEMPHISKGGRLTHQ